MSASGWSKIFRELHVRKHDILELDYLNAIHCIRKKAEALWLAENPSYMPFSAFGDKDGYAGFSPSRWYLNAVYMDYMEHIRPILDQCVAALTGYIIKWDHSFKLPKLLMKLDGSETFSTFFTLLNEVEQIRYQVFTPTKSLDHVRDGLKAMVKSLEEHGHAQPIMGFSDNPQSDSRIFMECISSLAKNIKPVQINEFSNLHRLTLPSDVDVHACYSEQEIQTACGSILEQLSDSDHNAEVHLGFDMEWEFSTGPSAAGPRKTALVQIALWNTVYLFQVYTLKRLPGMLCTLLASEKFVKIGRNVRGDLTKLSKDFPEFAFTKQKEKHPKGIIELGHLAKAKNAVAKANASLAAITAATLHKNLSKEACTSQWSVSPLSDEQMEYAALDAWVGLQLWKVLKNEATVGQTLKMASPVGQLVSIYVAQQEVARGCIISQPQKFCVGHDNAGKPLLINISSTKTRAVIMVDEVLAKGCILKLHNKSLAELQGDLSSFEVAVNLSMLRTRSSTPPASVSVSTGPPRELDDNMTAIKPPNLSNQSLQEPVESSDEDSEDENENENFLDSSRIPVEDVPNADQGYIQAMQSGPHPSNIVGDVLHVELIMGRTLKKRHTLRVPFNHALSATLLVPDRGDQRRAEVVLTRKGMTWDYAIRSCSEWLWKRVRRYIPKKDLLYKLLKELFDCWGPIICSTSKIPLFDDDAWKKANSILHNVQMGWLADLDGIPMYVEEGVDSNGLTIYHCLCGTNSVEGAIHNPIRCSFASLNASPELGDCLVADFRHCHNTEVGTKHKMGFEYKGHYDPWLDHEILSKRADIQWKSRPPAISSCYDSDPLSFAQTEEQFGIPSIPTALRIACDFGGPEPVGQSQDSALVVSHIYPTQLHLSKLKGTRADIYTYLAAAQKTKFAMTPLHTNEEFSLFNQSVNAGGAWSVSQRQPNFGRMATWWSSKANGKTIFYKLPEYLASYHKKWLNRRQVKESLVASELQRRPIQRRIHSDKHSAQVLTAASRNRPGIVPDMIGAEFNNHDNEMHTEDLPLSSSILEADMLDSGTIHPVPADPSSSDINQMPVNFPQHPNIYAHYNAPVMTLDANAATVTALQAPIMNLPMLPAPEMHMPVMPVSALGNIPSAPAMGSFFTWGSHNQSDILRTTGQTRRPR